mmetsp:Transcript_64160/g.142671  ORF Transcript_64160/g.142671 Transcript_64160/m.142671 type:complete len:154 (-) Transcript_64160:256-717(-)
MAYVESNQPQVVQATVVGQPAGQPVVGQPIGTSPYGGPQYYQQGPQAYYAPNADVAAANNGWMLYGIGWFLCCCFGPVGPIFWLVVACMHFCKPEEQRKMLPEERQVACCSLWTGVISIVIEVALVVFILAFVVSTASAINSTIEPCYSYYNC